ncbi:hypothetical protein [Metapseudomonas otitidis]|uniref:hypothetical protein n=1 Tax=Metapseudomonas otitidis TaxID=319939 RepID=UPI00244C2F63|nr:hypothetical protein [Pseudomonas otitidis]MDH1107196.1 hypothetical protein [Pseudomonas otitidis]MDH1162799.1 hypothetical protein [Pseudomonas otitidis]
MNPLPIVLLVALGLVPAVVDARAVDTVVAAPAPASLGLPPLEPVQGELRGARLLHQADWLRVQFLAPGQRGAVEAALSALKVSGAPGPGALGGVPLVPLPDALERLAARLGVTPGPAPVVVAEGQVLGRLAQGFSLPVGRGAWLYGYTGPRGLLALGAVLEEGADSQALMGAFLALNREHGLLLVDWPQRLLLLGADAKGQVQGWRP